MTYSLAGRRTVWTVNRRSPLARGLAILWTPSYRHGFVDAVRGTYLTKIGAPPSIRDSVTGLTADTNEYFLGLAAGTGAQNGVEPLSSVSAFSALYVARPTSLAVRSPLGGFNGGNPDGCQLAMGYTNSDRVFLYPAHDSGATYIAESAAGYFVANELAAYGVSWAYSGSGSATFYKNGAASATTAQTGTASDTGTPSDKRFSIGSGQSASTPRSFPGDIYFVALWNRALTPEEHAEAAYDPWLLFEQPKRRFWVPSAAVTTYVFNPLSGRGGTAAQPLDQT